MGLDYIFADLIREERNRARALAFQERQKAYKEKLERERLNGNASKVFEEELS